MPFVQAKCPNCNGFLTVDSSKDAAICQFCETPFIVEKAINNFNVSNNFIMNSGSVINIINPNMEADNAESKIESKDDNHAMLHVHLGTFKNAPEVYPTDIIGLFDQHNNLLVSLNLNQTKCIKLETDSIITAYTLNKKGNKANMFSSTYLNAILQSNSLRISCEKATFIDVKINRSVLNIKLTIEEVASFNSSL